MAVRTKRPVEDYLVLWLVYWYQIIWWSRILTQVVREVRDCDRKISPGDILPLLTETSILAADCRVRWSPTDIKAGGTHDNINLVLNSIRSLDTLLGNFGNRLSYHCGIITAEGFEISISWSGSSTAYCEVLGDNVVRNLRVIGKFRPHILFGELGKSSIVSNSILI